MNKLLEIERKRQLVGALSDFLAVLQRQGFTQIGSEHEKDTYYSRPDVDFMQTVECLRVRERSDFAEVTYKPASSDATVTADGVIMKLETNLEIRRPADATIARQLLENIGMVRLATVDKHRQMYTAPAYKHVVIAVDELAGVGIFIEVEVMSQDKRTAITTITTIETVLGIAKYPIVTRPYRDMCMEAIAR